MVRCSDSFGSECPNKITCLGSPGNFDKGGRGLTLTGINKHGTRILGQ